MANFLVYRILDGKLDFADVPKALEAGVKKILVEIGHEELTKCKTPYILPRMAERDEVYETYGTNNHRQLQRICGHCYSSYQRDIRRTLVSVCVVPCT